MEIARLLAVLPCEHGSREYVTLPVVTGESAGSAWTALLPLLESMRPDAVVALGESAKADRVQFERVAVNLRDARIADNAGVQLCDASVIDDAPNAYFATLPLRAMLAACESVGVPAQLSLSAGTFLCNELMFRLLHRARPAAAGFAHAAGFMHAVGFIHVPQLPVQATARGGPSMDAHTSARGVHAALEVLAQTLRTEQLA
jgi:pyroglutamyl-peptidase